MRNTFFLVMVLSAFSAFALEPAPQAPIPDDSAQNAALAVVADVYKPDYEKAKSPVQKLELAKKLLGEGIATRDDSVSRFVLFRIARDIAAQQGDLVTAFEAIGRIDREYKADRMQMQVDVATKALKLATDQQACAALLTPLIDEAVAADRYDHAKSFAELTLSCALKGKDFDSVNQVTSKTKEIEAIAAEFDRVKEAKVALDAKPTDPDANFAVGRFLCLLKGDWHRGVNMLALGNNEEFKVAALLELEEKTDPLKLGDGWWKIAEGLDGTAKSQAQAYAVGWYRKALPGLSGLTKTRVERLVSQVSPTVVPKTPNPKAAVPHIWDNLLFPESFVRGEYMQLPPHSVAISKKEFSGPIEITVVARTEAESIRINAYRGACVIFNWEVDHNELRVHRPDSDNLWDSGSIARAKTTPLQPKTWYAIKWRITEDGMQVFLNDKQVFSEQRSADLSVASIILVRSYGSVIDVKEFQVRPIK